MPLLGLASCSDDKETPGSESEGTGGSQNVAYKGFYLMNEGNMGANKCTIDFYDFEKGEYSRNIYAERNPSIAMELGDTGNDMAVYGERLYVVVNGSHKVEVMDAEDARRIGQVNISSPRYITFGGDYAYVSSYVGGDNGHGSVVKVDLETLRVVGSVSVGYQPEEMAIVDGMLYVANSYDLATYVYDDKVTAVRLSDFTVAYEIPVAENLHLLRRDDNGNLWVSSRGNYADVPSSLFKLSKGADGRYAVVNNVGVPVSSMALSADKLYYIANVWNAATFSSDISYGVVDLATAEKVADNFITDGTEKEIETPYNLAVDRSNGDILLTDVKNYVSSGALFCFDKDGRKLWSVTTGDIPSRIAFLPKK